MPIKRRKAKTPTLRVTPAAVAAFKAKDAKALEEALGLTIYDCNPLFVNEDGSYSDDWNLISHPVASIAPAVELRRALIAAAKDHLT
jgi:hypothetical protein